MSSPARPTLAATGLTFAWPDGTPVVRDLDLVVPAGRSGLVGANGTGKSTLLRLLAGELPPSAGRVMAPERLTHLRQGLALDAAATADALLGISATRAALRRLEAGTGSEAEIRADLETVGEDWDVEQRTGALLESLGLPAELLRRRVGELSGGEVVRMAVAGALLPRPDVVLLDEPTNDLDRDARRRLHDVLGAWRGTMLVVSHDRELLERVEHVGELRPAGPRPGDPVVLDWTGGPLSEHLRLRAQEQEAAAQAVTTARADLRRQQRDRQEAERHIAQRARQGARDAVRSNMGKAAQHYWANRSERHAADARRVAEGRVEGARERLEAAEARLREEASVRVDLPGTAVPRGRRVLTARGVALVGGGTLDLDVVGPERIALLGRNGAGKTTLLRRLVGELPPSEGDGTATVERHVPLGVLPQRMDLLDDGLSVAGNAALRAPDADRTVVRARLARFGFRGAAADRPVGSLSGGERFRATLATVLLAEPPPQLLVLDEPTNNLDFASVDVLLEALAAYGGALLVVSHDVDVLARIGVERRIELG